MFQSTHPHGVRLRRNHPRTISTKFQSTHPHGVRRRAATPTFYDIRGFNPRTHTGCDIPSPSAATRRSCFNPRTHTGCDCHTWSLIRRSLTFQSTHPHGVRLGVMRWRCRGCWSFNPRTHTGCDSFHLWIYC